MSLTVDSLPTLPAVGLYRGVVLHWSAGRYRTFFDHYHFCILGPRDDGTGDGEVLITHPLVENLRLILPGMSYATHTRGRNSGRIGISAMAMYRATQDDYGAYRWTARQVETMCAVAGLVVAKYGKGRPLEEQVKTHFQWAVTDGYYPERWDWMNETPMLLGKVKFYARGYGWVS